MAEPEAIEQQVLEAVRTLISYAGDDPDRAGVQETPSRVLRSYHELFSGYRQSPEQVLKQFEEPCGTVVLLSNIEFYSTCEHHMIPFVGKASIAYLPAGDKVVGLSKLARLLEIYTRRLQIQERIGQQVVAALMHHLKPRGAACILHAKHFCMCARGVNKQHSVMTTSALSGVFQESPAARAELFELIARADRNGV